MANSSPQTFYPKISANIPPEVRVHLQLIYQKLINHTAAISASKGSVTNSTTVVENVTPGSGGGGGGSMIPGLGGVNDQTGQTVYVTTSSDNGVLLILNDASPVAVTLNSGISSPYLIFVTNQGAGLVTFTPTSGTINGTASATLPENYFAEIAFDGINWWMTGLLVIPHTAAPATHEWLNSYDATTGLFTQSQPAIADVSGLPAALALLAPIASPTFTGTVTQPDSTVLTAATTATSATAGAATALPATPAGYLQISINGTVFKVPYYSV